jgi:hypothetical protein
LVIFFAGNIRTWLVLQWLIWGITLNDRLRAFLFLSLSRDARGSLPDLVASQFSILVTCADALGDYIATDLIAGMGTFCPQDRVLKLMVTI